ncbi:hypothetical protein HRI_004832600 [Hibiscus trionum]|uniref:Uncharacterized protein n=1 Tax=Hibiscus trionum TaxID=183268 RepID=A0A9W7MQZ6_HIBTR|nr:hypothetical protein HRI_004832600 [Hibiscus trionum]
MSMIFWKHHRFNSIARRKKKATKHDSKVKLRRLIGQSQVRQKLRAVETEFEALREESKLMIQKSVRTQIRLALMFNILRAREEDDLAKAVHFTHLLREIVAEENLQQQTLDS